MPGGRAALTACFEAGSTQAEASLALVNHLRRAQLVTVGGSSLGFVEYPFSDAAGARSARDLESTSASGGRVIVIGPGERVTLRIGRPPPQTALQEIRVDPARGAAATLAGLAWTFVNRARPRTIPTRVRACLSLALHKAASPAGASDRALAAMRSCVLRASGSAAHFRVTLRSLAKSLLAQRAFDFAARLQRSQPAPTAVVVAIPGSAPTPVNPAIRVIFPPLGAVLDGSSTTVRLSATGGVAPYRFYIRSEPGIALVPAWVRLAPDGTLTITPPQNASARVVLTVYVVDAQGDYSEDLPY